MNTATASAKINKELEISIVRAAYHVLSDPDFGLELSDKAKKRLRQTETRNKKTISFLEIKKKYR